MFKFLSNTLITKSPCRNKFLLHAMMSQRYVSNVSVDGLIPPVRDYVLRKAKICEPDSIHVCDGSHQENESIIKLLEEQGAIKRLPKYENCWLARTDPADVARVESKTFISTPERRTTIPATKDGVKGQLGNWMSPSEMENALNERFPGCMKGRKMYVIPFSMGSVGGRLSKIGIELTDSPYVVASMRVMTRMGVDVLNCLKSQYDDCANKAKFEFVKALHSVGVPLPTEKKIVNNWPCNPEKTIIAHIPGRNEICSFGSGYGGNSLLGKKCFALRLGSILAKNQGWLAEHMLILGITNPAGEKRYIAAAFPSACGKTNLAMMEPTLPGYKVECVGDDIAWMKFDDKTGELRAINPEAGFFGVAPGTSDKTNPNAMRCVESNTIFTNVAETSDGGFFWEGLEKQVDLSKLNITDWQNNPWTKDSGRKAAHPNSRFCTPASQCPTIDPDWESSEGVPISAIILGGRRPEGVPLVFEARNWQHGVFLGASMRSETTAAAEHKSGNMAHDPFAMRPFFGYNFGDYLGHWLKLGKTAEQKGYRLPRIYHVNWFRKRGSNNGFLWPGFGENSRVLDWILRRLNSEVSVDDSIIGGLPHKNDLKLSKENGEICCSDEDMTELFGLSNDFWQNEVEALNKYFNEQVGDDLPNEIREELDQLQARITANKA